MISLERDWVPTIASQQAQSLYNLTVLNATMRRIDLVCKLVSPIVISLLITVTKSVKTGVIVLASMSLLSWGIEIWCARHVWQGNLMLQRPKVNEAQNVSEQTPSSGSSTGFISIAPHNVSTVVNAQWKQMKFYFSTEVWIPSLSLALLHLSVLSYSATFLTYLLSSGFSLLLITVVRSISSIVEVSSTFVTPVGVRFLSQASKHGSTEGDTENLLDDDDQNRQHTVGLERLGLWGLLSQFLNLVCPI